MGTKINFQVLNIINQDSGALGPLGMVVHQFHEPGKYYVGVHREGRAVANTAFEVDLAGVARKVAHADARKVSPKGYVLFHASAGSGYSATVSAAPVSATVAAGDERVIFDSTKLGEGDLFATSLLEPGKYSLVNAAGTAKTDIEVTFTPEDAKRLKSVEPLHVDVASTAFALATIRVISSQGLVFRVKDQARVVITRQGGTRRERKPVLQWRKPLTAK
jgi:hypothetical protein